MKTENTCVNCAILECNVRLECEDNELPTEFQESKVGKENVEVIVQVMAPLPAEKGCRREAV